MIETSSFLRTAFAVLPVAVVLAFVAGVHRAGVSGGRSPALARRDAVLALVLSGAWMALTLAAAASGRLSFTSRPPTMVVLFVALIAIAVVVARSSLGRRLALGLPLAALVGFHAFRLPLELVMHRAYEEGVMPEQMSYSGWNFDIVTGITAVVLAILLAMGRASIGLVRAWNVLGTLLLVNIVTIALLSAPTPLRVFMNEPANVWVTQAPFVWLPAVLVLAALLGHLVLFRRLASESRA